MYQIYSKLKLVKSALKEFNKKHFSVVEVRAAQTILYMEEL